MVIDGQRIKFYDLAGLWVDTSALNMQFCFIDVDLGPCVIHILRISESTHARAAQTQGVAIEARHTSIDLMQSFTLGEYKVTTFIIAEETL